LPPLAHWLAPQVFCLLADEPKRGLRVAVNPRVLLIEDSISAEANERALVQAGYKVSPAAGEEALQIANNLRPDIILLDMLLPKIRGHQVLKVLEQNPAPLDILFVALTNLSQKSEERLLQEGAAAFFEKPTLELDKNSYRLVAAVETVLRWDHPKNMAIRSREAALTRAAADHSTTAPWGIEVTAVESSPCTTTILLPPLKS
jgi:CheY-like chemotaxis protein